MTHVNVPCMASLCVQYWNLQPSLPPVVKGETELSNWQCHNSVNGPVQIGVPRLD